MKALLVGESPVIESQGLVEWLTPDASRPRTTAAKLLAYSGWSLDEYLEKLPLRVNLLDCVQPKDQRASTFDRSHARWLGAEQVALLANTHRMTHLVVLGKRAAGAFTWEDTPDWFRWNTVYTANAGTLHAVPVPHPTGANGWWNLASNRQLARKFFESW